MSKSIKERVLVIDDEPDLLELIEVNLKGAGYEVLVAATGFDFGLRHGAAGGAGIGLSWT